MLKPNAGRVLSAAGAAVLIVSLFVVWYHVDRAGGVTETTTGWDTFPRLRVILLVGALLTLASAVLPQSRPVLVARTVLGLVLAVLIVRRIVDPSDISDPVSSQVGVFLALAGALAVAAGGLVDSGRRVVAAYPSLGGGDPDRALPPPRPHTPSGNSGAVVRVPNEAER